MAEVSKYFLGPVYLKLIKCSYINLGGLGKGTHWMNMVIKDDDAHHHTHAEQHGVCVSKTAPVLPLDRK